MFKEKLYNGTLSTITGTTTIRRFPVTTTISVNTYKTDLLNSCIVDFLVNECEISNTDCVYYPIENGSDERKGNLFLYGTPLQYVIVSTNVYWSLYSGAVQIDNGSSASTTNIFNGSNYNFKICLIGNPNAGFSLFISNYNLSYASSAICAMGFYRLKNIVDEEYWTLVTNLSSYNIATSGTNRSAITKSSDSTRPNITSAYFTTASNVMNGDVYLTFPNKYPLVPKIIGQFFEVVSGYEYALTSAINGSTSTPSTSYFYRIGTDTYCLISSTHGILVKL